MFLIFQCLLLYVPQRRLKRSVKSAVVTVLMRRVYVRQSHARYGCCVRDSTDVDFLIKICAVVRVLRQKYGGPYTYQGLVKQMCWWARKQRFVCGQVGALFHTVSKTFRYARAFSERVFQKNFLKKKVPVICST